MQRVYKRKSPAKKKLKLRCYFRFYILLCFQSKSPIQDNYKLMRNKEQTNKPKYYEHSCLLMNYIRTCYNMISQKVARMIYIFYLCTVCVH